MSLASLTASSSSVNVTAESTGPNTSSRNTVSSGLTESTVGFTKYPPRASSAAPPYAMVAPSSRAVDR